MESLKGIVSKSTLICGDGRVCVHYHSDCNPLSDCRCDCSLGICQQKLGVTWFTWVTVAMSTRSGDRHRFGSLWVAFFRCWVWVLGRQLQAGWRSWVAQCTAEGGHHMWVAWHLSWMAWHPCWVSLAPPRHYYFGFFSSIFL